MKPTIVTFACTIALLLPSASIASDDVPDRRQLGDINSTPSVLDDLVEVSRDDVPEAIADRVSPGGKVFVAPEGFTLDHDQCVREFGDCVPFSVVTEHEEYLTDTGGNRIDIVDGQQLDEAIAMLPGTYAAPIVGYSSSYRWDFNDTIQYAAVVGGNVISIGSVRTTHRITLSGRSSTWKQSSDSWTGPSIKATNHWNCVDDNGSLPNSSCTGGWQRHGNRIYQYGVFWSQDNVYHSQVETYWYDFRESWKASGWSGWTFGHGAQTSHHFDCPSGQSCRF